MSLFELLAATLLLLLVTMSMTAVVSLALRQYYTSLRQSEARVLSSTLSSVLTDELGSAGTVWLGSDGSVGMFLSKSYQDPDWACSISEDDEDGDGFGYLIFQDRSDTSRNRQLLSQSAYPNGLGACVSSCSYDTESELYSVCLQVGYDGEVIEETTFQVIAINPPDIESLS